MKHKNNNILGTALRLTKQGNYTNGHWLLSPRYFQPPPEMKVSDENIWGKENVFPDEKNCWPKGRLYKARYVYACPDDIWGGDIAVYKAIGADFTAGFPYEQIEFLRQHIPLFRLKLSGKESAAVIYAWWFIKIGLIMPCRQEIIDNFNQHTCKEKTSQGNALGNCGIQRI